MKLQDNWVSKLMDIRLSLGKWPHPAFLRIAGTASLETMISHFGSMNNHPLSAVELASVSARKHQVSDMLQHLFNKYINEFEGYERDATYHNQISVVSGHLAGNFSLEFLGENALLY